jgi:hypothetical protein
MKSKATIRELSFLCNGEVNTPYNNKGIVRKLCFSWGHPKLYNEDYRTSGISSRVEAGSNTSNVAQRVVGGDEKRTQCLGV